MTQQSAPQQPNNPQYAYNPSQTPPPPPGAGAKKKGWVKWVIAVVVLLVLGGCINALTKGSSDKETTTQAAATTQAGEATKAATTAAGKKEEAAAGVGTAVKSGDIEFTITAFTCGVSVTEPVTVTPQGKFCQLGLTAKNVGTKQVMLSDSQVVLTDDKGAEYKASSDTFMAPGAILLKQINPGNTLTGTIYVDVPADVTPTKAVVKGDLFAKGATIKLA